MLSHEQIDSLGKRTCGVVTAKVTCVAETVNYQGRVGGNVLEINKNTKNCEILNVIILIPEKSSKNAFI